MRVVGVCGSLQAKSSNAMLLQRAVALAPSGVEVALFDGLGALPHFNPDLEAAAPLPAVMAWRAAIAASDALLIATPEYGHSLPGVLKNAVDWVIGTAELEGKLVAITAATVHTERGRRGLGALRDTLHAVSAHVIGGEPIVRGALLDRDVEALLQQMLDAHRERVARLGV